jgi:tetratricopeptide (TPR) repeat protein
MSDLNAEDRPNQPGESAPGISADALGEALDTLLQGPRSPAQNSVELDAAHAAGLCPDPGEWIALVLGQARPADATALMSHGAACRACAARLRLSLQLMTEKASPEETSEIGRLASVSKDWQHKMAVKLAGTPHKAARRTTPGRYLWAGAALAASLMLAAGISLWWQQIHTPERLLAEAYSHSRIFALRMPGAGYAEITPEAHLRGSAANHESSRLLDARTRIEQRLERTPDDPHWLQLEARADLLDEKYDQAIDILDRLLAAGPVTSSLLADDAAAYFQRGTAVGSENDRATALEYLLRADELTPSDPVVLFNEAVAMEDRGQVMNAVETWNRYLHFESDPRWLAEGRNRLQALEQKLNRLKSHQSRIEQYLATPQAMRALAADPAALAPLDEELSSSLLPHLLDSAFPLPVDRSRGSPCDNMCLSARALLHALANSLEHNHQDSWLTHLLPPDSSSPSQSYIEATQALSKAIAADVAGDYLPAQKWAHESHSLFHSLANAAGEDRSQVELSYALQRFSNLSGCYQAAHELVGRNPQFVWIQTHALTEDAQCDPAPGTESEDNPAFLRVIGLARDRHYTLLELRARNLLGAPAIDTGDAEASWRIYLPTVRKFYAGDYPPLRLYNTLSGLAEVEGSTPRLQHALRLQREVVGVLALNPSSQLIPTERFKLASAAIRAGAVSEAKEQMQLAQNELSANGGGESVKRFLAEGELEMAGLYLDRRNPSAAAQMLNAAQGHLAGENNSLHRKNFAVAKGRLEFELGHAEDAELMLRASLIEEERLTLTGGAENIPFAQQDRELYAVLAGIWLAEGRSGEDVLALWERFRLRTLGIPVSSCPDKGLTCLKPQLSSALQRLGQDRVQGQVILFDRVLLYRATAQGVVWTSIPFGRDDVLAAVAPLERAVSSPTTSQDSIDQAARRVGSLLFGGLPDPSSLSGQLLIEPDPLLGNLPWPAVETASGPIGLHFDLAESPSMLLMPPSGSLRSDDSSSKRGPLVVGASLAAGNANPLPEVQDEAKAVARFDRNPNVLLGSQATLAQVAARLTTASAIHFAGHASEEGGATRLLLASSAAPGARASASSAFAGKTFLDSSLLRRHPPRQARLAVFSACSTGKKEEGWNHGMGDIVDTLAALGVPDVVATRWQIDSNSAVPMMDAFYGNLAQGLTVSHALTAARQSLNRDPRYRHPYYWAAYYASGAGKSDLSQVFQPAR